MGLPEPFWSTEQVSIYCGDALELLPLMEPASVSLIIADPPYRGVKLDYLGEKLTWDRQWPTREAYLSWLRSLAKEWQRILKPNGSLYVFASPQLAAWVEVTLSETFNILNHITWRKHDGSGAGTGGHSKVCKEKLRSFFPQSERILFCEHLHSDAMALGQSGYAAQCEQLHGYVFEPLRAYLDGERRRAGISRQDCNTACGVATMADRHYFVTSQWQLPTKPHYEALQQWFNEHSRQPAPQFTDYHPAGSPFVKHHPTPDEDLHQEYSYLRQEYEDLRQEYEDLRRPFAVTKDVPYTDVFDYQTVTYVPGKHPAEKPLPLLRHLIEASSRPGDVVLDPCFGSGSTLEAAKQCGRKAIGIEIDPRWVRQTASRLSQELLF